MKIEDKYKGWYDIYWNNFVYVSKDNVRGSNIPFEKIDFDNGIGYVGDGTINMAGMLQLLLTDEYLYNISPVCIEDVLDAIYRLMDAAYDYFNDKFPFLDMEMRNGFFVRDDISNTNEELLEKLNLEKVVSNMNMLESLTDEDPCHSPFVSQDQVWNLNPILMAIAKRHNSYSGKAMNIGFILNDYIKTYGYTVYNPYLSMIKHFFEFLPDLKSDYYERQRIREESYRPDVKVKRGANNWYYSGGTKSCVDAFQGELGSYNHSLRTFIYRGEVFFLDRIWDPLLRMFKTSFKTNAIYCYASTSGIWYNKKFARRLSDRFNTSLRKNNSIFQGNVVFLAGDTDRIDFMLLKKWLDSYPEPEKDGVVESPVQFLYLYNWYKIYTT